jgi:peptidase E
VALLKKQQNIVVFGGNTQYLLPQFTNTLSSGQYILLLRLHSLLPRLDESDA